MFNRWHKALDETDAELNIIPVMNLFMVLIPFLMLGAAFFSIGVIPVSTPTHSPDESDVPTTPTTVTANLAVTTTELDLSYSSTNLSTDKLADMRKRFPARADETFDLDALQRELRATKETYPKSTTVIVLPADDINYQVLVSVLDSVREYRTGKQTPAGEPEFAELFPVTVFSRFIPPEPEPDGEEGEEGVDFDFAEEKEGTP